MAVTIGGEAFGILGMLFSVPVCAVLFSLYLEYMKNAHTF
jgi:predicted PurR-regulated permease PerM